MRLLLLCATFLFALPAMGEEGKLRLSATTHSLVKWTPKNWALRERELTLPGSYTKCGNYLFVYTPSFGTTSAPKLLGFGIANAKGGIDSIIALDARGGRVRLWEGSSSTPPSVKEFRENSTQERTDYLVALPPEEYALVRECLGVKKEIPRGDPKKMIQA